MNAENNKAIALHEANKSALPAAEAARRHDEQVDQHEQPLIEHLIELRSRLLRSVLAVLIAFFPVYYFANDIYRFVSAPLIDALPPGSSMIATQVASTFMTPLKLAFYVALFGMIPYILHQAWSFIAPGLYTREKSFGLPLLVSSVALFYLGAAFAYFLVFPTVFAFFIAATPDGVQVMTDINQYLDFALTLFFAFGAAFEIPVATVLMIRVGITDVARLQTKRPYVIVGCFVVGAVLTPPDVISQVMMAVPMWLLYEVGLVCGRWVAPSSPAP